ncbi:MAG: hypothetical protein PUC37_13030 [Spirochaetales bacterium]|nr:hypothetical protein [Spirochaetales bacterium]
MEEKTTQKGKDSSWIFKPGKDDDIVLSCRARLIRNLADFKFPQYLIPEEKERIDSLVYDALNETGKITGLKKEQLNERSFEILKMNGFINDEDFSSIYISEEDDSFSCLVNNRDHIRLSIFSEGKECENIIQKIYNIDSLLQKKLQFAANVEFGYLTSNIKDCGSGLKISFRLFIPAIIFSGHFEDVIALVQNGKFCLRPVFKPVEGTPAAFYNCIFELYTSFSFSGTEFDQMANILGAVQNILNTERKIRAKFADNNSTVVLNLFKQNYAKAMYSMLLTYEDAVNAVCAVKWGLSHKLIKGISDLSLNSLFHRTKDTYLKIMCEEQNINFEADIEHSIALKIQRLRAILLQQSFEEIENENPVS